jgi:uncharacterized protein (TIGR02646 family)
MRKIRKTHPPPAYRDWLTDNRRTPACCYDALPGGLKRTLRHHLLDEQGWLCAYTGLGIDEDTSHIEHLKPQSCCVDGEDVDYRNLVACFPLDGGDTSHGFGAPMKGHWWDPALFVSPLDDASERRFRFTWSGRIAPRPDDHPGARETIAHLGLDGDSLAKLRFRAIRGFLIDARGALVEKSEARRLLAAIDRPDADGRLRPFCFVLKQLLERIVRAA